MHKKIDELHYLIADQEFIEWQEEATTKLSSNSLSWWLFRARCWARELADAGCERASLERLETGAESVLRNNADGLNDEQIAQVREAISPISDEIEGYFWQEFSLRQERNQKPDAWWAEVVRINGWKD